MNKKIIIVLVGISAILLAGYFTKPKEVKEIKNTQNSTFLIQGQRITLVNGKSDLQIPNSSQKILTRYFGNDVSYDFNNDGYVDSAFIVTQETGGSGTFYYLVLTLNKTPGFVGGEAIFIGDRIAPQNTNIDSKGIITVNYADRNPGEDFSVRPSLGKSLLIKYDNKTESLGELVQNFEGEADPSKMNLFMKKWVWQRTELNDGTVIYPKDKDKFVLTFKKDNSFSLTTDCNGVGGDFKISGNKIEFKNMISTLMYCEGSQENIIRNNISDSQSYLFTSKGELVLNIKFDSGSVIFK